MTLLVQRLPMPPHIWPPWERHSATPCHSNVDAWRERERKRKKYTFFWFFSSSFFLSRLIFFSSGHLFVFNILCYMTVYKTLSICTLYIYIYMHFFFSSITFVCLFCPFSLGVLLLMCSNILIYIYYHYYYYICSKYNNLWPQNHLSIYL